MSLSQSLQRIRSGLAKPPFEIVYASHSRWPYPRVGPLAGSELRISILDSSFNPPTLAHLALVNHPRPNSQIDYDAKLLLLSVTNADKKLKPADPTYEQRVEMMLQLAADVTTEKPGNVAVAIVDEPTFVGKASLLQQYLNSRVEIQADSGPPPSFELTFLQGVDTLERLFSPKYYSNSAEQMHSSLRKFFSPLADGDNARVVCAARDPSSFPSPNSSQTAADLQEQILSAVVSFLAKEGLPSDRVQMIETPKETWNMSSSSARHQLAGAGPGSVDIIPDKVKQYINDAGLYRTA